MSAPRMSHSLRPLGAGRPLLASLAACAGLLAEFLGFAFSSAIVLTLIIAIRFALYLH